MAIKSVFGKTKSAGSSRRSEALRGNHNAAKSGSGGKKSLADSRGARIGAGMTALGGAVGALAAGHYVGGMKSPAAAKRTVKASTITGAVQGAAVGAMKGMAVGVLSGNPYEGAALGGITGAALGGGLSYAGSKVGVKLGQRAKRLNK